VKPNIRVNITASIITLLEGVSSSIAGWLSINEAHAQCVGLQLLNLELTLKPSHSQVTGSRRRRRCRHLQDNHSPTAAVKRNAQITQSLQIVQHHQLLRSVRQSIIDRVRRANVHTDLWSSDGVTVCCSSEVLTDVTLCNSWRSCAICWPQQTGRKQCFHCVRNVIMWPSYIPYFSSCPLFVRRRRPQVRVRDILINLCPRSTAEALHSGSIALVNIPKLHYDEVRNAVTVFWRLWISSSSFDVRVLSCDTVSASVFLSPWCPAVSEPSSSMSFSETVLCKEKQFIK